MLGSQGHLLATGYEKLSSVCMSMSDRSETYNHTNLEENPRGGCQLSRYSVKFH
jgi:hypothetical protein